MPDDFTPIAAVPSKTTKQEWDPFDLPPVEIPKKRRGRKPKQKLPPDEIERIKTNRQKNLQKKTRNTTSEQTQLNMVLQVASKLSKEELDGFIRAAEIMSKLPRWCGRRVLVALQRVYG